MAQPIRFDKSPGEETGPAILFWADRPGWAFDRQASSMMRHLNGMGWHAEVRYDATIPERIDADWCYVSWWPKVAEAAKRKRTGTKVLCRLADACTWTERAPEAARRDFASVAKSVDLFLAASREIESQAKAMGLKVALLPDSVDTTAFRPMSSPSIPKDRREWRIGWAGNPKAVSWLGIKDVKGIAVLESARAFVPGKWSFATGLAPDDMPEWVRGLSVYVCASRLEGTPLPVLEAMATGRIVVTTSVGIVPELQSPGVIRFDGSPEGLATALLTLDPEMAAPLGSENRAEALARSEEEQAKRLYSILVGKVAPECRRFHVFTGEYTDLRGGVGTSSRNLARTLATRYDVTVYERHIGRADFLVYRGASQVGGFMAEEQATARPKPGDVAIFEYANFADIASRLSPGVASVYRLHGIHRGTLDPSVMTAKDELTGAAWCADMQDAIAEQVDGMAPLLSSQVATARKTFPEAARFPIVPNSLWLVNPARDRVLFVGTCSGLKGAAHVVQVAQRLPNLSFLVVGKADQVFAQVLRAQPNILYLNELKESLDVSVLLRRARLLLVPSAFEGCPYTIVEAMREGTPLLTYPWPGVDGMGLHPDCVLPARSADLLADRVSVLYDDLVGLERIALHNLRSWLDRFSMPVQRDAASLFLEVPCRRAARTT